MYSEVMKTVQCAHPHHHQNGFVTTMDGQWQSSCIVSVRTNRVLNKH